MSDHRALVLARIEYLQAELAALAALLHAETRVVPTRAEPGPEVAPSPTGSEPKPAAVARSPRTKEVDPAMLVIDPVWASEVLGVTRPTVDRKLKDPASTAPTIPGAPTNLSRGGQRARWRWGSEADVRTWWTAVT